MRQRTRYLAQHVMVSRRCRSRVVRGWNIRLADPAAEKRALEERYCDPEIREPFIAALSSARRD